jgi:hypothetical protein
MDIWQNDDDGERTIVAADVANVAAWLMIPTIR